MFYSSKLRECRSIRFSLRSILPTWHVPHWFFIKAFLLSELMQPMWLKLLMLLPDWFSFFVRCGEKKWFMILILIKRYNLPENGGLNQKGLWLKEGGSFKKKVGFSSKLTNKCLLQQNFILSWLALFRVNQEFLYNLLSICKNQKWQDLAWWASTRCTPLSVMEDNLSTACHLFRIYLVSK